jgi:hypothetical protein
VPATPIPAALIAEPNVELLTLTEMVNAGWRIADAVNLPVWVDSDRSLRACENPRPLDIKMTERYAKLARQYSAGNLESPICDKANAR